jgi:hypothetical protein
MKKEELVDKYIEKTGYGMDMWGKEENHVMTTIAEILDERQIKLNNMKKIKWYEKQLAITFIISFLLVTWYFVVKFCLKKHITYENEMFYILIGILITSGVISISGIFFDKDLK